MADPVRVTRTRYSWCEPKPEAPSEWWFRRSRGPSAKSGSRIGLDGQRYEQGTRGYLDSLIDEMARNGDPRALSMRSALNRGALSYRLVKARVSGDEWAGYSVRNFDIG